MQIALALYPRFTALDIIGPFQALADVPGHEVVFVAGETGPVVDHTGRDAGSPSKAPADVVELAKAALDVPTSTAPSGAD